MKNKSNYELVVCSVCEGSEKVREKEMHGYCECCRNNGKMPQRRKDAPPLNA